ncbi:hypothetical protein WJ971_08115 [Achromobacter xylosoxidans]
MGQAAAGASTASISASVCERWYIRQIAAPISAITQGTKGTTSVKAGGQSRQSSKPAAAITGSAG